MSLDFGCPWHLSINSDFQWFQDQKKIYLLHSQGMVNQSVKIIVQSVHLEQIVLLNIGHVMFKNSIIHPFYMNANLLCIVPKIREKNYEVSNLG